MFLWLLLPLALRGCWLGARAAGSSTSGSATASAAGSSADSRPGRDRRPRRGARKERFLGAALPLLPPRQRTHVSPAHQAGVAQTVGHRRFLVRCWDRRRSGLQHLFRVRSRPRAPAWCAHVHARKRIPRLRNGCALRQVRGLLSPGSVRVLYNTRHVITTEMTRCATSLPSQTFLAAT